MGEALTLLDVHDAVRHSDPKRVGQLMGLGSWVLLGRVPAAGEGWAFRTGERSSPMPPARDGTGFYPDTQVWPLVPKRARTSASLALPVLLGRSRNNDVIINHVSISKLHARLMLLEESVTVEDAASRNGTHANGRVVTEGNPVSLKSGDLLTVGSVVLTLFSTSSLLTTLRHKVVLDGV